MEDVPLSHLRSDCSSPMTFAKTTRVSLVFRLRDHNDAEAWSQFVDIYGSLIYRYGRHKGLQDADAADLSQDVLREVSRSIVGFDYDPTLGRFRNWLFLITRRTLARRFRKETTQPRATGDTQFLRNLQDLPEDETDDLWEQQYRQHIFHRASHQIISEFAEKTWLAFWRTAVDGEKPAEVAKQLGLSVGSVYVAKNRILRRLREKIAHIDDTLETS